MVVYLCGVLPDLATLFCFCTVLLCQPCLIFCTGLLDQLSLTLTFFLGELFSTVWKPACYGCVTFSPVEAQAKWAFLVQEEQIPSLVLTRSTVVGAPGFASAVLDQPLFRVGFHHVVSEEIEKTFA